MIGINAVPARNGVDLIEMVEVETVDNDAADTSGQPDRVFLYVRSENFAERWPQLFSPAVVW